MKNRMKKQIPNIITISRIVSTTIGFILFCQGKLILALIFYIYGAISDFLDGYFARKFNAYSKLGKYLDAISSYETLPVKPGKEFVRINSSGYTEIYFDNYRDVLEGATFITIYRRSNNSDEFEYIGELWNPKGGQVDTSLKFVDYYVNPNTEYEYKFQTNHFSSGVNREKPTKGYGEITVTQGSATYDAVNAKLNFTTMPEFIYQEINEFEDCWVEPKFYYTTTDYWNFWILLNSIRNNSIDINEKLASVWDPDRYLGKIAEKSYFQIKFGKCIGNTEFHYVKEVPATNMPAITFPSEIKSPEFVRINSEGYPEIYFNNYRDVLEGRIIIFRRQNNTDEWDFIGEIRNHNGGFDTSIKFIDYYVTANENYEYKLYLAEN